MRKKVIILVAVLIVCALTLSACDELSGASAYEVAVKNGFVGTELEWLESLKTGSSAYQVAVNNGFVGTEAEWLASLSGKNGIDGADGKDTLTIEEIYAAAKEKGFVGSFLDFITQYLSIDTLPTDNTTAVSKASLSAVSIFCSNTATLVTYTSAGSGIIYKLDTNGNAYIITNYHVVYDKNSAQNNYISRYIFVLLYGMENTNSAISASYVGGSMTYDIAVLRVEGSQTLKNSDSRAVTLCPDNYVTVGQTAIAIGNPEAKGISATSGIVSVDSESIEMTGADDVTRVIFRVMRVDTAINSGNSGGGLFNNEGELIGIVNAKIIDNTIENIGYAIPISTAISVAENIIVNCTDSSKTKMQRCLLGVTTIAESSKATYDADTLKTVISETIKVHEISENSLAKDKLQVGDTLVRVLFRGKTYELNRSYVLVDLMLGAFVNETIVISLIRNNTPMDVNITLTPASVVEVA